MTTKPSETIVKTFDPQTDVPAWAQRYGDCVALAKSDLSFRADLWTAKTEQIKNHLRGEAERRPPNLATREKEKIIKTYTVTVKQNSDAFAAIGRFDPEAVIEFENGCVDLEYYTITSEYDLHHLLDAEAAITAWDVADSADDFPPDDPEPEDAPEKFQDWDCWYHPTLGFQQSKRTPKPIGEISDYALTVLMAGQDITDRVVAAAEWLRRYPEGEASRTGTKAWARGADEIALDLVGAQ